MIATGTATFIAAFITVSTLLSGQAGATSDGRIGNRDCVYDYTFMTDHECRTYRAKVLKAKSEDERLRLRQDLHRTLDARAKERGTTSSDWRGLDLPPLGTGATR